MSLYDDILNLLREHGIGITEDIRSLTDDYVTDALSSDEESADADDTDSDEQDT